MKSLVVGASAGLGRAISERLAQKGHDLFLMASGAEDLAALAYDLQLRFNVQVATMAKDLSSTLDLREIRMAVLEGLGGLDNLFLIAGKFDQSGLGGLLEPRQLRNMLAVNFTAPIAFINTFLDDISESSCGNIIGIGSISAVRARRNHFTYGACKRGLEFYFQGIRHMLAGTDCHVQFIAWAI